MVLARALSTLIHESMHSGSQGALAPPCGSSLPAPGELLSGHVRSEFERMQIRERALDLLNHAAADRFDSVG